MGLPQRRRGQVHVAGIAPASRERDLSRVQPQLPVALDEHRDELAVALPQRREHGRDARAGHDGPRCRHRIQQPFAQALRLRAAHAIVRPAGLRAML